MERKRPRTEDATATKEKLAKTDLIWLIGCMCDPRKYLLWGWPAGG